MKEQPQGLSDEHYRMPSRVDQGLSETGVVGAEMTDDQFESLLAEAAQLNLDCFSEDESNQSLISRLKDPVKLRHLLASLPSEPLIELTRTPTRIGQFELVESLGGGGMGQVYKARHLHLGRYVALKMLHPYRLEDPNAIRRFYQEMRVIGQLQNPHIVAASHADEDDGRPYLIMDFVEGQSLRDLVLAVERTGDRLAIGPACELIRQAALGIQFAHDSGIIHRDLKPGNIMLDRTGTVRVLDLGLAKVIHEEEIANCGSNSNESMTGENQILGTPDYMPPELIQGARNGDKRSDVYALGATLFRLVTGQVVYPSSERSDTFFDKAIRILTDPVPEVQARRPDIDPALAVLIETCLQKDPEVRIQSASELAERLTTWADPTQLRQLASASPRVLADLLRENAHANNTSALVLPKSPQPDAVQLPDPERWANSGRFFLAMVLCLSLLFGLWIVNPYALPSGGQSRVQIQHQTPETSVAASAAWATAAELSDYFASMNENEKTHRNSRNPLESSGGAGDLVVDQEVLPGLVLQPARHAPEFDWQLILNRPLSGGQTDIWKWSFMHVDVNHSGSRWANSMGTHVLIRDCQTGQVLAVALAAKNDRFLTSVEFHPLNNSFAVLSQSHSRHTDDQIEIRTETGLLRQKIDFGKDLQPSQDAGRAAFTWSPDGRQIIVWNSVAALVYDSSGNLVSQVRWNEGQGPAYVNAHLPSTTLFCPRPNSTEVAFVGSDAQLRLWNTEDKSIKEVSRLQISSRQNGFSGLVKWNPSGDRLLVACLDEANENQVVRIYSSEGRLLADQARDWTHADWSTNGKFLITDNGKMLDQDLQLVRQLPLSDGDSSPGSQQIVFWTESDDIVLCRADFDWQRQSGVIRRFRPSGAQKPTPSDPQPLQVLATNVLHDGSIAAVYHRGGSHHVLFNWSSEGIGQPSQKLPTNAPSGATLQPSEASISAESEQIVIRSPWRQFTLETNGALVLETQLTSTDRHDATYSPDGKCLAFVQQPDKLLYFQDAEGRQIREPVAADYNAAIVWSPDSRWITWQHPTASGESATTSLLDLQNPNAVPRSLGDAFGRVSFSPDGQWVSCLVLQDYHLELVVTDLATGQSMLARLPQQTRLAVPVWTADSKQVFAGALYELKDQTLSQVGDVQLIDWTAGLASVKSGKLLIFGRQLDQAAKIYSVDSTGSLTDSQAIAGQVLLSQNSGAHNLKPSESQSEELGVLLAADSLHSLEAHSLVLASLDGPGSPKLQWSGIAFDDGRTVSIRSTGEIIHGVGESELDRYFTLIIRYPGGPSLPLTKREFQYRCQLDEIQRGLVWAADLNATVGLSSGVDWEYCDASSFLSEESMPNPWPQAHDVVSLDFSGSNDLSDEQLQVVSHFSKLEYLSLSRTYVSDLSPLVSLSEIKSLDIAHTLVASLSDVAKLPALRQLNLSGTSIQSKELFSLTDCPNLESLDLSGTSIDHFALLDLQSLRNLRKLDITDCGLQAADIQELQEKLPGCVIRWSAPVRSGR